MVYVFGAGGNMHAVDLITGQPKWSRDLFTDYQADEGYFGAGSTPIVADDKLLVNLGGRRGAGIVALDLATGRSAWTATDEGASYSSPVIAKLGDRTAAIFVTRLNCVAVAPATGDELFHFSFGKRGPTVNAATPLVVGDQLFLTASYGIGAQLAQVGPKSARQIWSNDESLSSQYATPVILDGYLYGIHGREDIGRGELRCLRLADGKVQWSEADFGVAHLILAGDKLLLVHIDGRVALVRANPKQFQRLGEASIASETTRALPALASGRLLLRTNVRGGDGQLLCIDVASP
jgi:outer membrane protein assembly factor BamB